MRIFITKLRVVLDFSNAIGISPLEMVTMKEDSDNECKVIWDDGKPYDAIVIFKGTKTQCLIKEKEELNKEEKEDDDEITPPAPKARKGRPRKLINPPDNINKENIKEGKSKNGKDQTRNEDHKDAQNQPKFIVHLTTSPPRSPGPPLKDATNVNIGEFEANQVVIQDTSKEEDNLASTCIKNDEEDTLSAIMAMKSITMDTDGAEPPRRGVSPIHSVSGLLEGKFSTQLATMRTAIIIYMSDEQEYRFDNLCSRLGAIEKKLDVILSSGVAHVLVSYATQKSEQTERQSHTDKYQNPPASNSVAKERYQETRPVENTSPKSNMTRAAEINNSIVAEGETSKEITEGDHNSHSNPSGAVIRGTHTI